MLIQGITRKGNAIPMSPELAIKPALNRACKALNTHEVIYWADARTVVIGPAGIKSMVDVNGVWEAWAEGTVNVGKTIGATDLFHKPVPHTFKLHYKLAKDEWGIPDIAIVGVPELTPIERDPSKMAGPIPADPVGLALVQEGPKGKKPAVAPDAKQKAAQEQKP